MSVLNGGPTQHFTSLQQHRFCSRELRNNCTLLFTKRKQTKNAHERTGKEQGKSRLLDSGRAVRSLEPDRQRTALAPFEALLKLAYSALHGVNTANTASLLKPILIRLAHICLLRSLSPLICMSLSLCRLFLSHFLSLIIYVSLLFARLLFLTSLYAWLARLKTPGTRPRDFFRPFQSAFRFGIPLSRFSFFLCLVCKLFSICIALFALKYKIVYICKIQFCIIQNCINCIIQNCIIHLYNICNTKIVLM